jgi:hypothetical protein
MQIINRDETKLWLSNRELLDSKELIKLSDYHGFQSYIIPNDSGKKTALARIITELFAQEYEALLWIDEYGIWPSSENRNLFDGFRRSLGENRQLQDKPGHIFSKHDLVSISSLLSLILYFCWGAVIVSTDKNILIRISHDEILKIYLKSEGEKSKKILKEIESVIDSEKRA